MALKPLNDAHAYQIQAGTSGRRAGHDFERDIAYHINELAYPIDIRSRTVGHVLKGDPASLCLNYIGSGLEISRITSASAFSTGALATSEDCKQSITIDGFKISRCKSDLVLRIATSDGRKFTIGVSIKQCNNRTPTNAQLYFSTARAFSDLLRSNGLIVSDTAVCALRQFCGDEGFRPSDDPCISADRLTDPRRYFWEEINSSGRLEWEKLFSDYQDEISRLLFQKAYIDDPIPPTFLIHKTRSEASWGNTEAAYYSIEELIALSHTYQGFATKRYSVRKGSYKDPTGVTHLAPRFGVIQMQRGGQAQHPEQLQFNLQAGYFNKL
jgi:hypothetical protein